MASLDWHLSRPADVTLVELRVTSDCRERVRIRSHLQPVWPPRRQGRPATGWRETGFEGVATPDAPLVLGYASPAEPVDPPVELADREPISAADTARNSAVPDGPIPDSAEFGGIDDDGTAARALVRSLGTSEPPRAAVPGPRGCESGVSTSHTPESLGGDRPPTVSDSGAVTPPDRTDEDARVGKSSPSVGPAGTNHNQQASGTADSSSNGSADISSVAAIERRLDRAESLCRADGSAAVREAVAAIGGPAEVRALADQLAADRHALERLADRCEGLATRLDRTDRPLTALERDQ